MRTYLFVAASLLVSTAAYGQSAEEPPGVRASLGPFIGKMEPCEGTTSVEEPPRDRKGLIKLVLPKELDFTDVKRRASADQNDASDPQGDVEGSDPTVDGNPGQSPNPQPFDIHVKRGAAARFITVRVIKKKGGSYLFFDESEIQGITLGGPTAGKVLCGAHFTVGRKGADRRRQVVVFFVDTNELNNVGIAPFNIGVVPDLYKETPIFIDPKVRNDG